LRLNRFKVVTKKELKALVPEIGKEIHIDGMKTRLLGIITPYEDIDQASGWVFVVVFSTGTFYFVGVDHFTDYGNGIIKVEWYPSGVYVPAMVKDVLMYYPYGWVE